MSGTSNQAPEDEELARLFDRASVRPRPSAVAEGEAFRALHGEWRHIVQRRRRRRRVAAYALAASVLLAIAAAFGVATRPGGADVQGGVAAVVRVEGEQVSALGELLVGTGLATGADSRLALAWHAGGSLRMDEHTRIEFTSARSIRLVTGAVYFDSAAAAANGRAAPGGLSIETAAGEVVHVGTQFMLRVDSERVVVSVREGQVLVTGDGFELTVTPGEQLDVGTDGRRSRSAVSGYDESWGWARTIAPLEPLEGRTASAILEWVARETGRRLQYSSTAAETLARAAIIRGLGERAPEDALTLLPYFTDLEVEVRADAIVLATR